MVAASVALSLMLGPALAACGSTAAGRPSGSPSGDSGVQGLVVAGPSCPLETTGGPCTPRTVQADVEVLHLTPAARSGGVPGDDTAASRPRKVIAVAHADSGGRFRITLPPGSYMLQAVPPQGTTYTAKPTPVRVKAHAFTEVTVILDTGIR